MSAGPKAAGSKHSVKGDLRRLLSEEDPLAHHLRFLGRRPRLVLAGCTAVVTYFALQASWFERATRLLIAFDVGAVVYLAAVWLMMHRSSVEGMSSRAKLEDERKWTVLALGSLAAIAVLFAIAFEMHQAKVTSDSGTGIHVGLAAATILLAWIFMNTQFALHYAHEYYSPTSAGEAEGGLAFPQEPKPDYWDFMYFSFVIGMTFQVSDVQVTERALRRLVMVHGVIAFFFNVVILALVINMAASLI